MYCKQRFCKHIKNIVKEKKTTINSDDNVTQIHEIYFKTNYKHQERTPQKLVASK